MFSRISPFPGNIPCAHSQLMDLYSVHPNSLVSLAIFTLVLPNTEKPQNHHHLHTKTHPRKNSSPASLTLISIFSRRPSSSTFLDILVLLADSTIKQLQFTSAQSGLNSIDVFDTLNSSGVTGLHKLNLKVRFFVF